MDFGVLGFEGIVGPDYGNGAPSPSQTQTFISAAESELNLIGSGFSKKGRSSDSAEEDEWKSCKLQRSDDLSTPKTMSLHQNTPLLRSNSLVSTDAAQQDHMINFSLLKSEVPYFTKDGSFLERSTQNTDFSHYQHTSSVYTRNAGYGSGSLNASMHSVITGLKEHFTPSQMIELQNQALIYKYKTCNVPVPSNLLIPLKKSVYPYGFTSSALGSLSYNSLGWGAFHLRYTGNTDPEPGRCRRTDGKKWRCSRDAVVDQKYCERHINRGRHRSRKPVEGQTGQAAYGVTNSKVVPMSSSMSTSVNTIGSAANSLAIARQHQFKNLQSGVANRIQDQRGWTQLKSNDSAFTITKQGVPFAESSLSDFGHVASGSLVNPSHRSLFLDFTSQETQDELKPDWTQLSMSTSEFSPSSSSPAKPKLDLSSLGSSREFDPIQMGLGVNNDIIDQTKRQANSIPISWASSMGGPLGEVLNNTLNNV